MSEMPEIDWQARLRAAVEETLRKAAARRVERAELKARRKVGLERRHARKLARANPRGSRGHQRGRGAADPLPNQENEEQ